jgi:hypothetical protein
MPNLAASARAIGMPMMRSGPTMNMKTDIAMVRMA